MTDLGLILLIQKYTFSQQIIKNTHETSNLTCKKQHTTQKKQHSKAESAQTDPISKSHLQAASHSQSA